MRVALLHMLGTAQKHVEVKVNLLLSVWLFVRVWNPGVVFLCSHFNHDSTD